MKNKILAACLAVSALVSAPASAALIEFDVSNLVMMDQNSDIYAPAGTFEFDTDTEQVSNVSVTSIHNNYFTGSYDSNYEAFGLFGSFNSPLGIVLNIGIDFNDLMATIAGYNVGDSFFIGADPAEYDNESGMDYGFGIDPGLVGVILPGNGPGPSPVPLPAGLPLLLGALGGLGYLRRKQKR